MRKLCVKEDHKSTAVRIRTEPAVEDGSCGQNCCSGDSFLRSRGGCIPRYATESGAGKKGGAYRPEEKNREVRCSKTWGGGSHQPESKR